MNKTPKEYAANLFFQEFYTVSRNIMNNENVAISINLSNWASSMLNIQISSGLSYFSFMYYSGKIKLISTFENSTAYQMLHGFLLERIEELDNIVSIQRSNAR